MRAHKACGRSTKTVPSRTYSSYWSMRTRCCNQKDEHYPDYGGRGITVCPEWGTFKQFLLDMGERPKGKTLDRRDNSEGYSKKNCRWATPIEQNRNTRNSRLLTHMGATYCLREWAERVGLKPTTLDERLRRGWDLEAALCPELKKERPPCSDECKVKIGNANRGRKGSPEATAKRFATLARNRIAAQKQLSQETQ